ncbi:hypothetical protein GGS24DRAFT_123517 [Hypoxylon argillaceum]|nr:hypothetical protein GGS24DRAFT_123517 [Hypoxylon argillaceum]
MSLFNKLASRLDDLDLGGKDEGRPQNRDYPPPSQQYERYGGGPPPSSGYPGQYQQSYGSPPPPEGYREQSYSSPPPQSGGYPGQYQQPQYSSPPPPSQDPIYEHPSGKPPLPDGWVPQWDRQYQRWYYAEEATGRTQWEAPGARNSESRGWGSSGDVSHGGSGYDSYSHAPPPAPGYEQYPSRAQGEYYNGGQEKKKKDHTLLYAAGGLAAGAIGGALIANALNDSDDEEHHSAPPPQQYVPPPSDSYGAPGPAFEPLYNEDGEYVDASDRESVASAREEYEAAQRAAADSDASSSEEEELEEAREEYYDEYEETYE